LFSKLEIIFCVFLSANNFVNALIPFIGGKENICFVFDRLPRRKQREVRSLFNSGMLKKQLPLF